MDRRMTEPAPGRILVGTSGFSYDDWLGSWYPPGMPKRAMLDFYADRFPALEVNATYYRTPAPSTARRMVERAAGRLRFAIKAPGELTHKGLAGPGVVLPFREFLEPFAEAGCLGPVLLQFPAGFVYTRDNLLYLHIAVGQLAGLPLAVELRSGTWDAEPARRAADELDAVRVAVDQPAVRGVSASLTEAAEGPFAYYRFHGRNAGAWYGSEDRHGRYNYRYGREELEALAREVRKGAPRAQSTYVFFNNHPDGNAAHNAGQLGAMLGLPPPPESPRDLFEDA